MNSRTDPILAQWRVILVSSTDNSIQLEQFINANMAKCQCVVKGIWAFSLFFPREIDSFALELCFIVDFVCQIVFRKMGNKFPFDVTAKDDGEPPPPHRFTTRAGLPDGSWRHFESFSTPEPALPLSIGTVIWPIRAQPISYPESSGFLVSGITLPKKPENDPETTRRRPEDSTRPKTDPVDTGYEIASDCEQWETTYILMDLASLFLWSFGKKSC